MRLAPPSVVTVPGAARDVMLEVLINGPVARTDVARRLGLDPGHTTRVTQGLIDDGLLKEEEGRTNGVGRPTKPLVAAGSHMRFLGMKVAPGAVHAVICDLSATILAHCSRPLPAGDPLSTIGVVEGLVRELSGWSPMAIGITLGAQVKDGSTVSVAPIVGWRDVELGPLIEEATGLPTLVTNDMIALTAAEHWFGVGRGSSSLAVLTIGAGVGYGLVANGRIVTNADMGLGLIGHERVSELGGLCSEGHRGCAMSVLSFSGLEAAVSGGIGRHVPFEDCLELAVAGNAVARAVVDDAADALASLVRSIATLAMPEKILLSGEGVALAKLAWDRILEALVSRRPQEAAPVNVTLQAVEESEWARGAAVTVIQWCMGAPIA